VAGSLLGRPRPAQRSVLAGLKLSPSAVTVGGVSLPENERRVLAAISARLDADEAATLPLTVDDLGEDEVVAAAVRLDHYDPPVWDSVSTEEAHGLCR
jgi:hypothetical protein